MSEERQKAVCVMRAQEDWMEDICRPRVEEEVELTHAEKRYQEILRVQKSTEVHAARDEQGRDAKQRLRARLRQIQANIPDGPYFSTWPRVYEP